MAGRKYVSEFRVAVGPVALTGSLYPLQKSDAEEASKYKAVCPDCKVPTKPYQMYVCPTNPSHMHPMGELDKAKEIGGQLVRADKQEVEDARKSKLALNQFVATVHPANEVLDVTWHAKNSYVFVPKVVDEYYGLVVRMVAESGRVFVAMANVKNFEGFYRLAVWQNHLVLQRLHWPDECETFDSIQPPCPDAVFEAAKAMLDKLETPFKVDEYKSTVKQQLEELQAKLETESGVVVSTLAPKNTPKEKKPDLLAVLAGFDA